VSRRLHDSDWHRASQQSTDTSLARSAGSEGAGFAALDRLSGHNFEHNEIVERKEYAAQSLLTASNNGG
jgi:hypothetical protein